jgi:type II secretory pathway component GspD/PulD (secretin)
VSADRRWLTLEIEAAVESEDDENFGQVFAPSASEEPVLLAEKQGSSSKKVRTFARIPERTSIIIGGLVSKKKEVRTGKFPIPNKIPSIGRLFSSKDNEIHNREIIIVLTPDKDMMMLIVRCAGLAFIASCLQLVFIQRC